MLLLSACAQSSAKPNTNAAAMRVFNVLGISLKTIKKAGCCGALSHHLSFHEDALAKARRNIDAWWPEIEAGAEAIVITASGCGTMVKDYSSLLKNDKEYTVKADKISQMCRDISEVIIQEDLSDLVFKEDRLRTAVHCPCSLQHGQNLPNIVEDILEKIGVHTIDTMDKHICCGSAGSYSILQPDLSNKLLKNKLQSLVVSNPDQIVTANIGCQMHLESSSKIPVLHWIEIFDDNLVYKNRL
jgi:glycolate oxidase iron-sulfur subunit